MLTDNMSKENGYEKYAGTPFFTFDSLFIAASMLYVIYLAGRVIVQHDFNAPPALLLLPLFCVILYFGTGYTYYYFMLSDEYFAIKNHRLPWKKVIYPINDIETITYVSVNASNWGMTFSSLSAIEIELKNSVETHRFIARTLGKKTWKAFHEKLHALNIPVSCQSGTWYH